MIRADRFGKPRKYILETAGVMPLARGCQAPQQRLQVVSIHLFMFVSIRIFHNISYAKSEMVIRSHARALLRWPSVPPPQPVRPVREALPRHRPPYRDHGGACARRAPAAPGTSSRASRPSRPIRWRKPMRWPTPSRAAICAGLKDELGDLLLQVVFHARMAEEQGAFDFGGVVEGITAKLIRRHPHVFADAQGRTAEAVKGLWERIKARGKGRARRGGGGRAGRGAARPARVNPRAQAAGKSRPRRLRLERRARRARQDPRGSRRDRSRARRRRARRGRGRNRRPACSRWSTSPAISTPTRKPCCAPPTPSSSGVLPPSKARWPRAARRRRTRRSPRWTRCGTRRRRRRTPSVVPAERSESRDP